MTSEKERLNIARPCIGKEMVDKCVADGCSNIPSDRVSLLKLPSDGILRRTWEKQVQRTLAQWKATKHSFLCSDHFTEDCFEGKWAAMVVWDGGKGVYIPITCCEMTASCW